MGQSARFSKEKKKQVEGATPRYVAIVWNDTAIPLAMIQNGTVLWCIRLTRFTLVCEVIGYRLVQVQQNLKKYKTNLQRGKKKKKEREKHLSVISTAASQTFAM